MGPSVDLDGPNDPDGPDEPNEAYDQNGPDDPEWPDDSDGANYLDKTNDLADSIIQTGPTT